MCVAHRDVCNLLVGICTSHWKHTWLWSQHLEFWHPANIEHKEKHLGLKADPP